MYRSCWIFVQLSVVQLVQRLKGKKKKQSPSSVSTSEEPTCCENKKTKQKPNKASSPDCVHDLSTDQIKKTGAVGFDNIQVQRCVREKKTSEPRCAAWRVWILLQSVQNAHRHDTKTSSCLSLNASVEDRRGRTRTDPQVKGVSGLWSVPSSADRGYNAVREVKEGRKEDEDAIVHF